MSSAVKCYMRKSNSDYGKIVHFYSLISNSSTKFGVSENNLHDWRVSRLPYCLVKRLLIFYNHIKVNIFNINIS